MSELDAIEQIRRESQRAIELQQQIEALRQLREVSESAQPQGGVTPDPVAVDEFQSIATDVAAGLPRAINNGFFLGFGDNAEAALGAALGLSPNGEGGHQFTGWGDTSFGDRYRDNLELSREDLDQFRQDYPALALTGEAGGGVGNNIMTGGYGMFRQGDGLLRQMLTGGLVGAGEGAVYGAGEANGDPEAVLPNMAVGGTVGGIAGAGSPVVMALGNTLLRTGGALANIGNEGRAQTAFARALWNSGRSTDDIVDALNVAAREGQPDYVVADAMGRTGQRTLAGVTSQPGEGMEMAADFLERRQAGMADRVGGFLDEAFDPLNAQTFDPSAMPSTAPERVTTAMGNARTAAAQDPVTGFEAAAANARPVNLNGAIDEIDTLLNRPIILQGEAGTLAEGPLGRQLMQLRDQLTSGSEQLIDFQRVMDIRTNLRTAMDRNPQLAARLRPVYQSLTDALDASSDTFLAANNLYAQQSRQIDAVGDGAALNRRNVHPDTVAAVYGNAGENQSALRTGYVGTLQDAVNNARPGNDVATPLLTPRQQANAATMASDPALLSRRLNREAEMHTTRAQALGGSRTAELLADQAAANGDDLVVDVAGAVATGQPGALARTGAAAMRGLAGRNEGTRTELARLLLSRDPQALFRAMQVGNRSEATRMIIDALLRNAGRIGGFNEVAAR